MKEGLQKLLKDYPESSLASPVQRILAKVKREERAATLLAEAQEDFDQISSLKWNYRNLLKYNRVAVDANHIVSTYRDTEAAVEAQHLIIQCYDKQGKYKRKYAAFSNYVVMSEKEYGIDRTAQFIAEMGEEYFNKGEYSHAKPYFAKLARRYPKHKMASYGQYMVGECYFQLKDYNKATKELDKVLEQSSPQVEWATEACKGLVRIYYPRRKHWKISMESF